MLVSILVGQVLFLFLIHSGEIKFSLACSCIYDFTEDWESASEDEHFDDSDESWIDVHHSSDEEADKTVSFYINTHQ